MGPGKAAATTSTAPFVRLVMHEERSKEWLEPLALEDIEIEEIRTLIDQKRWPRVYMLLERIRERIKRKEAELGMDGDKAA